MIKQQSMIEKLYFLATNNTRPFKLQIFTADGKEFSGVPSLYHGILCLSETADSNANAIYIDPFHVKIAKIIWD